MLTQSVAHTDWTDLMPRGNAALARSLFSLTAALVDVLMIFLAAMMAGIGYHQYAFGESGPIETSPFLAFAWEQAHDCATAAAARDLRAAS